jgi:hypothetical protein
MLLPGESVMAAKTKSQRISTVTQIENLKPRNERYEVADAKCTGNRLVVFPSITVAFSEGI